MKTINKGIIRTAGTGVLSLVIGWNGIALAQESPPRAEEKNTQPFDGNLKNTIPEDATHKGAKAGPSDFISRESMDKFIDSLGEVSRDTAIPKKEASSGVRTVLDLRIPLIDQECDITISHQMLKLAYAYYASFPNSDVELRRAAEQISRLSDKDLSAVSPQCKKNLRGFAFSILKVFLGSEWSPSDTQRVKDAVDEKKSEK